MKKILVSLMLILPLMAAVPTAAPVMATYGFSVYGPN